jgi:hypothetical protein
MQQYGDKVAGKKIEVITATTAAPMPTCPSAPQELITREKVSLWLASR